MKMCKVLMLLSVGFHFHLRHTVLNTRYAKQLLVKVIQAVSYSRNERILMKSQPTHYIELAGEIIKFPIIYRLKLIKYALSQSSIHLVDLETSDCMFLGRLTVGVTPAPQIFTQSFFEKNAEKRREISAAR